MYKRHTSCKWTMHIHRLVLICLLLICCSASALAASAATLDVKTASKGTAVVNKKILVTTGRKTLKLKAYYGQRNVTSKAKWKSSKKSVAYFTRKGKLRIKRAGVTKITCRYKGKKKTVRLVVAENRKIKGIPASQQKFIDETARIATRLYPYTGILPSVVIAQCCLETGYGLGKDAELLVKQNNLLGMKAALLNDSWKEWTVWNGRTLTKQTPEFLNGEMIMIQDAFRSYPDYYTCILDYEMFLLNVKYKGVYKYRAISGWKDPRKVITRISQAGYATDPSYIEKVMRIISVNNLTKYDPK